MAGSVRARAIAFLLVAFVAAWVTTTAASANWLTRLGRASGEAGVAGRVAKLGSLEAAAAFLAKLPPKIEGQAAAFAAHLSHEGHWTFVNRAGEKFTAANADELKRVVATLAPAATGEGKIAIYIAEPAALAVPKSVAELPRGAELFVLSGQTPYRVVAASGGGYDVVLKPGLITSGAKPEALEETLFHTAKSLNKANIRLLALEPGGPQTLSYAPRLEAGSSRALIDVIDPAHLPNAFGRIKGQTAVIVGDIDGTGLKILTAGGGTRTIALPELYQAAANADVSLVILRSANARQPGGRNWLWIKSDVKAMDDALAAATFGDFLAAFARPSAPLRITSETSPFGRTSIVAIKESTGASTPSAMTSRVGDVLNDLASELAGKVVIESVKFDVPSRERQKELDLRIVPWLPSGVQWAYIVALLMGVIGSPVSRRWWQRVWPAEARAEYRNAAGYLAAKVTRAAAYLLLFMPVVSIAAMPWHVVERVIYWVKWPFVTWRRLRAKPA